MNNLEFKKKFDMGDSKQLVPAELIEKKRYLIRGHKVMLDRDLAALSTSQERYPFKQERQS